MKKSTRGELVTTGTDCHALKVPHFIHCIRVVIVDYTQFDRIRKLQHRTLLDPHNVGHRDRYLNAVAFVVGAEDDLLEGLDPFFGTGHRIRLEVVFPLIGSNREGCKVLAICKSCLYAISKVDVPIGKVQF